MYKTAVITDEISQDLCVAADVAVKYGLQGLEIRSVWGKGPFDLEREDVEQIGRTASTRGLEICAIAPPLFKCEIEDQQARAEHISGIRRCMEAADRLGARLVRGFTFWSRGHEDTDLARVAEAYEPVLRLADQYGVDVAVESEPSVIVSDILRLDQFIRLLDHPRVGALYDPGNEMTEKNPYPPYPDGYERLRGRIRHVHVKDMRRGLIPSRLGEGDVDFHGLFPRLRADGYEGYVSVETHYREKKLSDELLALPAGEALSAGGLPATEGYLTALRDVYHWMEEG